MCWVHIVGDSDKFKARIVPLNLVTTVIQHTARVHWNEYLWQLMPARAIWLKGIFSLKKKKKKRKETVFQQDQEQNAKAGYWNLGKRKSKRKAASGCQEVTNKDLFYLQGVGDVWRSARRESSLQGHFVSEMILPQFDSLAQAQQNDFIWLVDTPFPWQVLIWQIFFSDNTRKKMVSERLYRSHICPKMKSQPIKTSSQSWGHQNATAFSH